MADVTARRHEMVERQIVARGVRDPRALPAMRTVPREAFVSPWFEESAYDDKPLSIEEGQTISQPYIGASMIASVHPGPNECVLEIGPGSLQLTTGTRTKQCRSDVENRRLAPTYLQTHHSSVSTSPLRVELPTCRPQKFAPFSGSGKMPRRPPTSTSKFSRTRRLSM
ncbi:MAG: hypothetical protein ABIT38_21210 [Gemmatimonadaceae bacterium]